MNELQVGREMSLANLIWFARRGLFAFTPRELGKAVLRRLPIVGCRFIGDSGGSWDNHPFDDEFGTDTGEFIYAKDLRSGRRSDIYATGYSASPPSIVRKILRMIPDHERTTFVDLGCGKGRALIVASEFPFKTIVGVEIASRLVATAKSNAEVIRCRFPERTPIKVVEGDALDYVLPPGPVAIFLYNPFHKRMVRMIAEKIRTAGDLAPRSVYIVYCNPVWKDIFDRSSWLNKYYLGQVFAESEDSHCAPGAVDDVAIWESRPGGGATIGAS